MKCPKCKGTKFSVMVVAYQDYDGEDDEWGTITEIIEEQGDKPYFCKNCGGEFDLNELENEEIFGELRDNLKKLEGEK